MVTLQSAKLPEVAEFRLKELGMVVDCLEETSRVLGVVIGGADNACAEAVRQQVRHRAAAQSKWSETMPKRLLAVVDGSERTRRVLDYLIGYAASVGPVEAVILSVEPNPDGGAKAALHPSDDPSVQKSRKQIIKSATRRLNRLGIVHKSRVEAGDPALTIVRCAEEERCDLIILNDADRDVDARRRSGESRRCEESVSREVAHLTSVPLVVAR